MDNYKIAIRENYMFQTNVGDLTPSQLFTAADKTLILLEESLKEVVKSAKKPNRFQKSATKDRTPRIKLAIVSDIIDTIIEEREASANAIDKKAKLQELLAEQVRRGKESVKEMSDSELNNKIKVLNK